MKIPTPWMTGFRALSELAAFVRLVSAASEPKPAASVRTVQRVAVTTSQQGSDDPCVPRLFAVKSSGLTKHARARAKHARRDRLLRAREWQRFDNI